MTSLPTFNPGPTPNALRAKKSLPTPRPALVAKSRDNGPPLNAEIQLTPGQIRHHGMILVGISTLRNSLSEALDYQPTAPLLPRIFFAAHWVSEIDVCLTDKLLASAEHSKRRFEPRPSAKNVIACFALRSILTC